MRSALTMLGIIIGVAAVVIMVAIGEGASRRVSSQIQRLGSNLLIVTPGRMREPWCTNIWRVRKHGCPHPG